LTPFDEAFLDGFRRGDDSAVREFYGAYHRLVFAISFRVLGNRALAEDATQQTFIQAWKAAATFEAGRDAAPWLATIARRAAIDIQRRERRRPSVPLDSAPIADGSMVALPLSMEQVWETWQLRAALDGLESAEREIMRLQHLEGLSQVEVAERLGIPVGTVKSRSFRAHRVLARTLAHLREPTEGM
jgi:RNA polymerase sigma-70 factor (ECF subfamily)